MTDRTPVMLVCVYYRVAASDAPRVIAAMREIQRTLAGGGHADEAEVLLRCDLPPHATPAPPGTSAPLPDARLASLPSPAPAVAPRVDPGADATVMETYRLRLPPVATEAGGSVDAAVRDFLALLETASSPLAGLLRGARHVELFAPCAS